MTYLTELNPAAMPYIQTMNLGVNEEEFVRSTLANYTLGSMCGIPCWLIYRITNAVRSLFYGTSDWQIAIRMIKERALVIAGKRDSQGMRDPLSKNLFDRDDLNPERKANLNARVENASQLVAEKLLTDCYEAYLSEVVLTDEALEVAIRDYRLDHFIDRLLMSHVLFESHLSTWKIGTISIPPPALVPPA